jgi:hypothetical protein
MEAQQTVTGNAAGAAARWGKTQAWWQWHPDIDLDILGLLSILATYADDEGYCDPSQRTLGKRAHRCRRNINALIARAEALRPRVLAKVNRSRRNGGTTSCLYRVIREAPPEFGLWFAADRGVTPANDDAETPVPVSAHAPGTVVPTMNQPQADQNNITRPLPREVDSGPVSQIAVQPEQTLPEPVLAEARPLRPWEDERGRLARDWQPGPEVISEAFRLYPNADLEEHTALFVSRSRSKRYRHDDPDESWLAWLIEDQRKARERAAAPVQRSWPGSTGRGPNYDRFDAWSTVAASMTRTA